MERTMIVFDARTYFFRTHRRRSIVFCYLSAGILLHVITVLEWLVILAVISGIEAHPLEYPILAMVCLFPLFTQLDARSRYQEYKKVRDLLIRHGPDGKIFRSVSRSRCQRDAALAAARQLGYGTACRSHFAAAGYSWYHLVPDFVSHNPRLIITSGFLRATFFAPTYHSRYPNLLGNGDGRNGYHSARGPKRFSDQTSQS